MDTLPFSPRLVVIILFVPLATLMVVAASLFLRGAFRAWRSYRGVHVIQCPETRKPAAVRVDTGHFALSSVMNDPPDVQLASCSRWPERAGCDEACVPQIEHDPIETRIDTILRDVFANHSCALCGRRINGVPTVGHKPAFLGPDGRTTPCTTIAPEHVYDLVKTHRLICWDCEVAETFRREHPELVIDAPVGQPRP
jgi:hypothetical protein